MSRKGHSPCLIVLYIFTVVIYVTALVFSFLSSNRATDLFERTASNVSAILNLQVTPASWTFTIWGFIYAWQAIWLLYAFTLICRRSRSGYLYVSPGVLPPGLFIAFSVASASLFSWLFLWDRIMVEAALGTILLISISLHVALGLGHHRLAKITPILREQGNCKEIWFVWIFVLNGIAFFNTWVTTATCFNVAHVMAYGIGERIPQEAASTAALVVLTSVVFVWFMLKNFIFERHMRYTYSPFIVLPVAIMGVITNNWDVNTGNSIFTAMLLALVGVMFLVSVIITFVKIRRDRRNSTPYNVDIKM